MAEESSILELLSAREEPTAKHYQGLCTHIIARPQMIADLVDYENISELLSCLTHNNHRLVRLFYTLFPKNCRASSEYPPPATVTAVIKLFKKIIPAIQATDASKAVSLILPTILVCMTKHISDVRDLASILVCNDDLVRRIVCDDVGVKAIQVWASSPNQIVRNARTLEAWTETLFKVVKACVTDHGLTSRLSEWEGVTIAKAALHEFERSCTNESAISSGTTDIPNLARMDRLSPAERQSLMSKKFASGQSSFDLPKTIYDVLNDLGIDIPSKPIQLRDTIEHLEHSRTLLLLRAVAATFPCAWCKLYLDHGIDLPEVESTRHASSIVQQHPPMTMGIFGQSIGIWPMFLSSTAIATLRSRQRTGTAGSVEGKLTSLASGSGHMSSLAGSRAEKRCSLYVQSSSSLYP
ncbi:MAG: hypothetical protein Q9207_000001 [Kuettlingeria erythrocarpa]